MPDVKLLTFPSKGEESRLQNEASTGLPMVLVPSLPKAEAEATAGNFQSRQQTTVSGAKNDLLLVCSTRRRSCALVNTPSLCINKAIHHIQELERKIEGWFQQLEHTPHQMFPLTVQDGKVVRFSSPDPSSVQPLVSTLFLPDLSVEGMGLCARESGTSTPLREETRAVLSEVIDLIARLEADRQEAEAALKTEKERRKTLGKKIDCLSLWRLQQLPAAVQKEHESCVRDICELQWHLKCKEEIQKQVQERLTKTEVLNQRLQDDIDFVKKHCPLLKEKMKMESLAISLIEKSQEEANKKMSEIDSKLQQKQQQFDDASSKAKEEQQNMVKEMNDIMYTLQELHNDLGQTKVVWNMYCNKVLEIEKKMEDGDKLFKELQEIIPVLEEQETTLNNEITDLMLKIEEQVLQNQDLKNEYEKLQQHTQITTSDGESKISLLREKYNRTFRDLCDMRNKNKECELEIEDLIQKIQESEDTVVRLQKERTRMCKAIGRNKEHTIKVKAELSQVVMIHSASKAKLEDMEQQTFIDEAKIRKTIENTRKECMKEIKELVIIKSKMSSGNSELKQGQTDANIEKEDTQKIFYEVMTETNQHQKKVEEFQKLNKETIERVKNLKITLLEHEMKLTQTEGILSEKKITAQRQLRDLNEQNSEVSNEQDRVLMRTEDLRKKTEYFKASQIAMEKVAKATEDATAELQTDFQAVEFKYKNAVSSINNLQTEVANCKKRFELSKETHSTLFENRQNIMAENETALQNSRQKNLDLALEYRALQKTFLEIKSSLVCSYDKNVQKSASLQDHQQLSLLQRRMHRAVVEYFEQRSLHSQAGLATFQALSHKNSQDVGRVQEDLSKAVQRISAFLHSLTDGSNTTEDAATNKQPAMDAFLKHKKKPTVQITV
ncbi:coiled-coil domain-containing protein 178 [Huso huso]|uniref:Coiled-coil domain-containing protein 178 n=1 Tax=Huso huso TaxID=61971 RepID=A0ABR1A4G8_HUSHU